MVGHRPPPACRRRPRTDRTDLARSVSRQRRDHRPEPVSDPPRSSTEHPEHADNADDDGRPAPIALKHRCPEPGAASPSTVRTARPHGPRHWAIPTQLCARTGTEATPRSPP